MKENLQEKAKQTAVEWLYDMIKKQGRQPIEDLFTAAKLMERTQHGNTWDAAIKAHEERGHVIARSICDFDDYKIS